MKSKYIFLLIILAMILNLFNCAGLLIDEASIKGKVKLSDNPSYGHGGVLVSCGRIITTTDSDGSFELIGDVLDEITLDVKFQKSHYIEKIIKVDVPYPAESDKGNIDVDVGTVILERDPETFFDDDFNRSTVGTNYKLSVATGGGSASIVGFPPDGKLKLVSPNLQGFGKHTEAIITAHGTFLTNMALTFDFDNGPEERMNNLTDIYLRYIDVNNLYRIRIVEDTFKTTSRQKIILQKYVAGSNFNLRELNAILLRPGRYEFKIYGNEISFKNVSGGTNIDLKVLDNTISGPGRAGFSVFEETTTFDNIVLSEIE